MIIIYYAPHKYTAAAASADAVLNLPALRWERGRLLLPPPPERETRLGPIRVLEKKTSKHALYVLYYLLPSRESIHSTVSIVVRRRLSVSSPVYPKTPHLRLSRLNDRKRSSSGDATHQRKSDFQPIATRLPPPAHYKYKIDTR